MADGHTSVVAHETRDKLEVFLSKLTTLSRDTGIAIAQPSDLFLMEPEDYAFAYICDEEGRLTLS